MWQSASDSSSSKGPPEHALAVVLEAPHRLAVRELALTPPGHEDVVVELCWSGISTGTERLLWSGRMPPFPGMGYPLVPGYESVGRITHAGHASGKRVGQTVFVPGASCYKDALGLFGGAASHLVVQGSRVTPVDAKLGERSTLLALAATAHHALVGRTEASTASPSSAIPSLPRGPILIVGHGVLGRLLARLCLLLCDETPVVWEKDATRAEGAIGYSVCDPEADACERYGTIFDVSGDASILDSLIGRLAPGGEVVLAGFYADDVSFAFPPAFMREARIRIAAEWQPSDLEAVLREVESEALDLHGLITHRSSMMDAPRAYETAFNEPSCLKMILDWRSPS